MDSAYVEIPLSGERGAGLAALVDIDDYPLVCGRSWNLLKGYAVTNITVAKNRTRTTAMHQLLTGWAMTDHDNRKRLDNRRFNLRPASLEENARNTAGWSRRASRFKGVSRNGSGWIARVYRSGVQYNLGTFKDEEEAALAYDAKARELFGEFAVLNFLSNNQAKGPIVFPARAWTTAPPNVGSWAAPRLTSTGLPLTST